MEKDIGSSQHIITGKERYFNTPGDVRNFWVIMDFWEIAKAVSLFSFFAGIVH